MVHSDHLGSSRLLTNVSGGIYGGTYDASAMDFSPYGERIGGTSSLTSYRFTGQYYDSLLDLQYHRARWLNPSTANWLSADPVFDFPGNFGNLYGYSGCNPVLNLDPTGLFSLTEVTSVASTMSNLVSRSFISAFTIKHVVRRAIIGFISQQIVFWVTYLHVMPLIQQIETFATLIEDISPFLAKKAREVAKDLVKSLFWKAGIALFAPVLWQLPIIPMSITAWRAYQLISSISKAEDLLAELPRLTVFETEIYLEHRIWFAIGKDLMLFRIRPADDVRVANDLIRAMKRKDEKEIALLLAELINRLKQYGRISYRK